MKWSWKLVRLAGIDVYVHATFLILLLWVALGYWQREGTLIAVFSGLGFILALFSCVVLHELGHALTARRYGIQTRDITLLPIGGVASLERMPEDPRQEIAVALAGPAVNFVIAAILWLWLSAQHALVSTLDFNLAGGTFLQHLMVINIILAVFNLLPAFPMDGGRVLRALLSMRLNRYEATQTAARIGQGLALFLGFLGLMYNPFLVFIALFVWVGAAAEAGVEQIKYTLSDTAVGRAMLTNFKSLSPEDSLARAVAYTLEGSQKDFPVLEGGVMVGALTQSDMLRGLQQKGEHTWVREWMQTNIQSADVNEPVQQVLERIQNTHCPLVSVTREETQVGIVNLDNISELIQIQTAIHEQHHSDRWEA